MLATWTNDCTFDMVKLATAAYRRPEQQTIVFGGILEKVVLMDQKGLFGAAAKLFGWAGGRHCSAFVLPAILE